MNIVIAYTAFLFLYGVTILNRPIIRLTSVTYAVRAQKLLDQYGIRSYYLRLTRNLGNHGCGYGLKIHGDLQQAVSIIESAGIQIVEVLENGEY